MRNQMCTCAVHCPRSPYHERACCPQDCDCWCHKRQTLVCDQCGAENWNLASEGKSHDQPANEVKGYEACAGVWRLRDRTEDRARKFDCPNCGELTANGVRQSIRDEVCLYVCRVCGAIAQERQPAGVVIQFPKRTEQDQ